MIMSKSHYDRQSVDQSVWLSGAHLGPATIFSFSLRFSFRPRRRSNCQTKKLKSGYGTPTKTNWPTDRRSQCNLKLNLRHCTVNYGPVLSSERPPYMKNKECNCHSNKCNIWSLDPKGARHQDELADWPSVVMWLRLRTRERVRFVFIVSESLTGRESLRALVCWKLEVCCSLFSLRAQCSCGGRYRCAIRCRCRITSGSPICGVITASTYPH
jgi:hypothetical protein